jgi:AcrR family transcriptional regulator
MIDKLDKKEIITRSAIDLFATKGFSVTAMRDIAKAAEVNVALLYYYFKNKEEILYYIIESSSRDLLRILKEIQSQESDPFECLKKMILRQVLFSRNSWKETKLITIEADNLHGQRKRACLDLQRKIYDIYMNQLQRLKKSDHLGDVNMTVINFTIFGMINWFYRWYKEGGTLSEEDVANEMLRIIELGILKRND